MIGLARTIGGVGLSNALNERTSEFSPFIAFNFMSATSRTTSIAVHILPDIEKEVTGRHRNIKFTLALDNENLELWRCGFRTYGHSTNVDDDTQNYIKRSLRKYVSPPLQSLPIDAKTMRRSLTAFTTLLICEAFDRSEVLKGHLAANHPLDFDVKRVDFKVDPADATAKEITIRCHRVGRRRGVPVRQVTKIKFTPFNSNTHVLTNWMGVPGSALIEPDEALFSCLYVALSSKARELLEYQAENAMNNL